MVRISELSRRSDVPVPTIKFYLREGLLPAGRLTSATQAQYDEEHLARLRLIRALVAGADLPVHTARQILALIDDPPDNILALFGRTQQLLSPSDPTVDVTEARELLAGWGWHDDERYEGPLRRLAQALDAARSAGFEIPPGVLDTYAAAAHQIAEAEIANSPVDSLVEAVRYTVLGSVLMESVLLAMRRLAEADVSVRAFGVTDDARTGDQETRTDESAEPRQVIGSARPAH